MSSWANSNFLKKAVPFEISEAANLKKTQVNFDVDSNLNFNFQCTARTIDSQLLCRAGNRNFHQAVTGLSHVAIKLPGCPRAQSTAPESPRPPFRNSCCASKLRRQLSTASICGSGAFGHEVIVSRHFASIRVSVPWLGFLEVRLQRLEF